MPPKKTLPKKTLIVTGNNLPETLKEALTDLCSHTDGIETVPASIASFASGEPFTELFFGAEQDHAANQKKIKDADVVIVQSTSAPVSESCMQLLLAAASAKRYGAKSVTAVMPFAAFARQDREFDGRFTSVAGEDFPRLLKAAGVDGIVTIDLHSKAAENFYQQVFGAENAHFLSSAAFAAETLTQGKATQETVVFGAPDGADKPNDRGQQRAAAVAKAAGLPDKGALFKIWKEHTGVSATKINRFEGDVAGKSCIIIDDMTDSGGTLRNAAKTLKQNGAKEAVCYITHGLFTGNALEHLMTEKTGNSYTIDRLVIADTVPDIAEKLAKLKTQYPAIGKRITIMPTAALITEKIKTLHKTAKTAAQNAPKRGI
tara:strand:+ start:95 stop:1216 length:1122 start_codon:yes stop_codon:yes gene_type:complete